MSSTPSTSSWDDGALAPFPSVEEMALGAELARWDSLELEVWESDPPMVEVVPPTDAKLLEALSAQPAATDLMLLASIDPMGLPTKGAMLDYLRTAERLDGFAAALKARARVALAGVVSSGELRAEVQVEQELAIATRTSTYSAGMAIERSRALTATFPGFLTALAAGEISDGHCRVLVEKTRTCTDPVALAAVERVTLPKARRMTPGQFARAVATAIADHDPDAAARYRAARETRSVWTRELEDGMSYLGMVHDTSTITSIKATLDTDAAALRAQRGGASALAAGEEDAAMGACRADALAARILGSSIPGTTHASTDLASTDLASTILPGPPVFSTSVSSTSVSGTTGSGKTVRASSTGSAAVSWTPAPARVQVQLVIDLPTLRGEADRHCLLDGQPVPAQIGRDLAGYATAFRRMVTDPLTGHLLDYGRTTYLPAPLRTYVLARDRGCRAPGCSARDERRLQLDHAEPFPSGPSDPANTGCLCLPHHQSKTDGRASIESSATDGSCDWISAWGQRVHIPARPFLHDPADSPAEPQPDPPDPPPF